jgi:hypothetical protein
MITYIELWKAKPTWIDLPKAEKIKYTNSLGPAIQQLIDNGVQIVSWGYNDANAFNRISYDYFAVWTFPDMVAALNFQQMVVDAGWYDYFDQVNAMGTASNPQEIIANMVE